MMLNSFYHNDLNSLFYHCKSDNQGHKHFS